MSHATYPLTIYYDASCALCNGEMSNLMLRNTEGLLAFVDASPADFVSHVPGSTRHDLMNMIHAVRADGEVVRGVEVFRLAYAAVGLGWVTAPTAWPVLRQLADRAYPWLVRNRYRIPRPLVALLFEGATRRAAERAAEMAHQRARCTADTCQR
jgi:predicted DCC family thiol-disulfide oxidoreductase YuxK